MKDVKLNEDMTNFETPTYLFKELDDEFHFYCDLAASKDNAKCSYYIDEEADSLSKPWHIIGGSNWMFVNPPYGRGVKKWVKKCDEEAQLGAKIVCLMPTKDETKYYHEHIKGKYEKRELLGRITFEIGGVKAESPARFANMIVIFEKGSYKRWLLSELNRLMD